MELTKNLWEQEDYTEFLKYLSSCSDAKYKDFHQKLVPNAQKMFGVRVPKLRQIAKEIAKGNYDSFLKIKKGDFHEEIIVEGLVMTNIKCEYEILLEYIKYFADKIYSWAICDTVSFKQIKKYKTEFWGDIEYFIFNQNPWVVRFGFGCLMSFYLEDEYIDKVLEYIQKVKVDFYYVQMMQAWLLATALYKCRDKTILFLEKTTLSDTVYSMTVRKIRDSYRVSKEDKDLVRTLRK